MIAILDYGIGNIGSISNMLRKIGVKAAASSDPSVIANADKLILPGVGHFDYCMQQLKNSDFYELLHKKVLEDKIPMLGVCVGCQMLMETSEEGREKGLGWIKGSVVRFKADQMSASLKIPHMDWTEVHPTDSCLLYSGIANPRFYFVHSYHVLCDDPGLVTATAKYGYDFAASVQSGNISGVQFHPEKSHRFGMDLYRNFSKLY
jgi:glutamine amidotransferase